MLTVNDIRTLRQADDALVSAVANVNQMITLLGATPNAEVEKLIHEARVALVAAQRIARADFNDAMVAAS